MFGAVLLDGVGVGSGADINGCCSVERSYALLFSPHPLKEILWEDNAILWISKLCLCKVMFY